VGSPETGPMERKLYPMKFEPIFKEKIWGGNKIYKTLGYQDAPQEKCGEVWVLSGVEGNNSIVSNGWLAGNELNEVVEIFMSDILGDAMFTKYGESFPVLIKFIDANDYLSIQVHPDDELAKKRNLGGGKTEMWYIVEAENDAKLISGFSKELDKETYLEHFEKGEILSILNFEKVKKGEVFYIPSGRVHALGPGIMLAEIQQTSDTTYRIYDWDRVDKEGKSRELHTDLALDALDFRMPDNYKTAYKKTKNKTSPIISTPYFTTSLLDLDKAIAKDYTELDSFVIYLCVEGKLEIRYEQGHESLRMGEALLIPAEMKEIKIFPEVPSKILEVYSMES